MTAAKLTEYRITRQILQRRGGARGRRRAGGIAERLITSAAVGAALLLTGSYLQELFWVCLSAGVVLTLGTSSD